MSGPPSPEPDPDLLRCDGLPDAQRGKAEVVAGAKKNTPGNCAVQRNVLLVAHAGVIRLLDDLEAPLLPRVERDRADAEEPDNFLTMADRILETL